MQILNHQGRDFSRGPSPPGGARHEEPPIIAASQVWAKWAASAAGPSKHSWTVAAQRAQVSRLQWVERKGRKGTMSHKAPKA